MEGMRYRYPGLISALLVALVAGLTPSRAQADLLVGKFNPGTRPTPEMTRQRRGALVVSTRGGLEGCRTIAFAAYGTCPDTEARSQACGSNSQPTPEKQRTLLGALINQIGLAGLVFIFPPHHPSRPTPLPSTNPPPIPPIFNPPPQVTATPPSNPPSQPAVTDVPEPGTILPGVLGASLAGLVLLRRRLRV
jgi:hypothetical protein